MSRAAGGGKVFEDYPNPRRQFTPYTCLARTATYARSIIATRCIAYIDSDISQDFLWKTKDHTGALVGLIAPLTCRFSAPLNLAPASVFRHHFPPYPVLLCATTARTGVDLLAPAVTDQIMCERRYCRD